MSASSTTHPPTEVVVHAQGLVKDYGDSRLGGGARVRALDGVDLAVVRGEIFGFLGPNGAGKSTTMRMILGLDDPTAGRALIDGRPYRAFSQPLHHVGALIESDAFHPSRSARNHLRVAARSNGIPLSRVDEVLEQVGIAAVAGRRVRTYSLGMRQRLGIAAALLGDPAVLLFDEPVNGLDADGVRWVRHLVRDLAGEGRTVLISSHLLSEMQQTADHLLVIGRGRLIADATTREVLARSGRQAVRVRASDPAALERALYRAGARIDHLDGGTLLVVGVSNEDIGNAARDAGVALHELAELSSSLEEVYLELTAASLEYVASSTDREAVR